MRLNIVYNTLILMGILLIAISSFAGRTVHYEPSVVELKGEVYIAKSQHPNGTLMKYGILELDESITVIKDPSNEFNELEKNIREVQLMSRKDALHKKLQRLDNKRIRVKGTLFHGFTAWHMRPVLMDVSSLSVE